MHSGLSLTQFTVLVLYSFVVVIDSRSTYSPFGHPRVRKLERSFDILLELDLVSTDLERREDARFQTSEATFNSTPI